MKVKVIGLKRFEGTVDGDVIKSGKLFCIVQLDDSRNGKDQFSKGQAIEELRVTPELIRRLEHTPLPFEAECETMRVSNGKVAREQVIDVRPLGLVDQVPPAPLKRAS